MISRMNIALAVVVLLVFAVGAVFQVDYSEPNYEFLPEMKYSPAYAAFDPNPNFAGGRTLQPPVAGTIARGEMPLHYAATKEDAVRAGGELSNPYDLETENDEASLAVAASVQRGGELFRIYCVCCHGATGTGAGSVSQRGFPPPPSLLTGKSLQMQDGQLFHILTYGQGSMSPFAAQLTPDQRWDAINYVRSMQQNAPPAEPAPEPEAESPAP